MSWVGGLILAAMCLGTTGLESSTKYPVSCNMTFQLSVNVEEGKGEEQVMVIDTGSRFSWILHYRVIRRFHEKITGGFSRTRLRTRIVPPFGGGLIGYSDASVVELSDWTRKKFRFVDHEWEQPFGINLKPDHVLETGAVGLIGATRDSEFAIANPIFGFEPMSRKLLSLNFHSFDPVKTCLKSAMTYFPCHPNRPHWSSEAVVSFGSMRFHDPVSFDTGSSIIALPQLAFGLFVTEMLRHDSSYRYEPSLMAGLMDCSKQRYLPTWNVSPDDSQEHRIPITPHMYVNGMVGNKCIVTVGRLPNDYPIIMGTPLLRSVVSEFDVEKARVGICASARPVVPDMKEATGGNGNYIDCPRCSQAKRLSMNTGLLVGVMFLFMS